MPVDLTLELRLAYLKAAHNSQKLQENRINTYRNFYNGEQAIELTERQKEYLNADFDSFANICKRVVQIPKERLEIKPDGISAADVSQSGFADSVTNWWQINKLNQKQKEVYEASLRDETAAVVVDWDAEHGIPTFTLNTVYDGKSGLVRFHYDDNGNLTFASKQWTIWNPLTPGQTGKRRLTIYRHGLIERYESDPNQPDGWRFLQPEEMNGMPNPQVWTLDGTVNGEPIGIPVIPFENPGGSELEDVLNIQELLNHSLASFDFAVDFHGYPLLYFVNADFERDEETGQSKFPGFGPGKMISMDEGGAAGRIEAADLKKMFDSGIMSWIEVLAIVKGWPVTMFQNNTSTGLSGIALQMLEGSMVKQIEDKQAVFGGSWADAFDVGRRIAISQGQRDGLEGELKFTWESPATAAEETNIEVLAKQFEVGKFPIISRWRKMGVPEDEIEQMIADKQREEELMLGDFDMGVEQ